MNCRPGDLAVVVRSIAGNEGRIVRCIEFVQDGRHYMPDSSEKCRPCWHVHPAVKAWTGLMVTLVADECLRPIRPGDISDEEVRDLYLPKVPEHAATRKPVHGGYPEHA